MDKINNSWILLVIFCVLSGARAQHSVIRFTSDEIKKIVATHNDLRRSIYNAANMRELTWSEDVAQKAIEWGSRCEYVSRPDNNWGQNMNYFYGNSYHKSSLQLFTETFTAWSNETMHYDYRRYRYCGSKNVCSYVQLIAADVQEVGCAIVKCPKLELTSPRAVQRHAKLFVCFYSPWVNILGSEVFIPDKRCAACPQGTKCVDNLCSARFSTPGVRTLPVGKPSAAIESISGSTSSKASLAQPRPVPTTISGGNRKESRQESRPNNGGGSRRGRGHRNHKRQPVDRVVGSHNSFSKNDGEKQNNRVYQEHRGRNETIVVYTPNNRVIPFPSRSDKRNIRRIEKFERREEKDLDEKQEKIIHNLELVANNITVADTSSNVKHGGSRKKRQTSLQDALYQRRIEYERYLREYEMLMRERKERRRRYEEQLRRREQHYSAVQELRRADAVSRYNEEVQRRHQLRLQQQRRRYEALALTQNEALYAQELRRRHRLREERRRYEALALLQNEGDLTGEEQFFTISAHNVLRREVNAKDLAWSSYLERWAKYVIRCETEYPGPIKCYTNFGKAEPGQDIYNVVYQWGAEGNDLTRPLRYGCRTPYDRTLCNHNSIIRNKSLTQMACASKNCGLQRQLTCVYSSG
ncbi:uncharacterized protein LOC132752786 isoform X2 [Ruditapes philippinarum]|uniref:uncharacterized protein LOC132752786 isoform X2 n=1 Tax=Ruditapes philippinarum TaxID=129788 RepID=UPI00295AB0A1|nr:uncharacterized protein LOC132752786 isoform X2 [Ruditapes philippinarum]